MPITSVNIDFNARYFKQKLKKIKFPKNLVLFIFCLALVFTEIIIDCYEKTEGNGNSALSNKIAQPALNELESSSSTCEEIINVRMKMILLLYAGSPNANLDLHRYVLLSKSN